jgi:TM2 domain-containing membrane protein YozV
LEAFVALILSVKNDVVEIGDNGQLVEVRRADLSFEPRQGDEVDIFRSETEVRVALAERRAVAAGAEALHQSGQGININLAQNVTAPLADANHVLVTRGKVVNKVAYGILALLVGGLGVHHFYGGRIGLGFVYLIFCWTFIPAIIAFVEGIVALCKQADPNGNIIV